MRQFQPRRTPSVAHKRATPNPNPHRTGTNQCCIWRHEAWTPAALGLSAVIASRQSRDFFLDSLIGNNGRGVFRQLLEHRFRVRDFQFFRLQTQSKLVGQMTIFPAQGIASGPIARSRGRGKQDAVGVRDRSAGLTRQFFLEMPPTLSTQQKIECNGGFRVGAEQDVGVFQIFRPTNFTGQEKMCRQ